MSFSSHLRCLLCISFALLILHLQQSSAKNKYFLLFQCPVIFLFSYSEFCYVYSYLLCLLQIIDKLQSERHFMIVKCSLLLRGGFLHISDKLRFLFEICPCESNFRIKFVMLYLDVLGKYFEIHFRIN